jgi:transcriptional regulator with XRE-family HTH domain
VDLVTAIAAEVRRHRVERGMSAQQLSDACAELGLPIARAVLANLESGRRGTVSVPELFVLAKALGVPPLMLLFPVGRSEFMEVLPGREMDTWAAAKWFTGEGPFLSREDDGHWYVETSHEGDPANAWEDRAEALYLRRAQDDLFEEWSRARSRWETARFQRDNALSDAAREAHRGEADARADVLHGLEQRLRKLRSDMRARGLDPGKLTAIIEHIDEPEPSR